MCKNPYFDHNYYLVGLQFKRAEYNALRDLKPNVMDRVVPLFTPSPHDFDPEETTPGKVDKEFRSFIKKLENFWGQRRFFIDLGVLDENVRGEDGLHPVEIMWREAARVCLFPPTPIPVVALDYSLIYKAEVKKVIDGTEVGICLRLTRHALNEANLESRINDFAAYYNLEPENIDLVVDFGIVDSDGMDFSKIYSAMPYVSRWRTFTCIGGSFPKNLSHLKKSDTHWVERHEWLSYKEQIQNFSGSHRLPTFGDFGIYYPKGLPPIKGVPDVSASVRYTVDDKFMVMRGESLKRSEFGYKQYLAHAVLLNESESFCGRDYSAGDYYIADIAHRYEELLARERGGTGGPESWLQAGFNHHFTQVVGQISELFGA